MCHLNAHGVTPTNTGGAYGLNAALRSSLCGPFFTSVCDVHIHLRVHNHPCPQVPTWLFNDTNRERLLTELTPDALDWLNALQADRGEFFRRHGVAVSAGSGFEYDQSFGFTEVAGVSSPAQYVLDTYERSGVQQDEDGKPIWQRSWNAWGMTHFGPLWHATHAAGGIPRRAALGDAVANDNVGAQFTERHAGWSNVTASAFAQWAAKTNRSWCLPPEPFDRGSFVRDTLRALKASGADASTIIQHPLIREITRYVIVQQTAHWAELAAEARRVAVDLGRPVPAVWGNQAGIWSSVSLHGDNTSGYSRVGSLVVGQASDVVWTELSGPLAGTLNDSAAFAYKILEACGRPRFACRYPTTPQRQLVACAEAAANNVVLSQNVNESMGPGTAMWEALAMFNRFAVENSWLLVDRHRLSDVGMAYSLPTVLWRSFSTVQLATAPRYNETTLAQHLTWLSGGSSLLDEGHVLVGAHVLGFPGIYPEQMSLNDVSVLILPGVDAVTDASVSNISAWVRGGGHLVLWGNASATLDEELRVRSSPAFCSVCLHCPGCTNGSADAGLGSVTHLATSTVQAAMSDPSARRMLVQQLSRLVGMPLVQTTAPDNVRVTVFAHGSLANGSLMRSVHLVHYADDGSGNPGPTRRTTPPFTLAMRDVPASSAATWFTPESPLNGTPLASVVVNGSLRAVDVPSFGTYGILVWSHPAETAARRASAVLRRLSNKIDIAARCRGQPPRAAIEPTRETILNALEAVQGSSAPASVDYAAVLPALEALIVKANATLTNLVAAQLQHESVVERSIFAAPALARFDFGPANASTGSTDGWVRVSPATLCKHQRAERASSSIGGVVSACWDRNESEMWFMEERTQSNAPEMPVLSTAMRSNSSATLVITGLTPNTVHNITLLCGSYQYYVDTAYNLVRVEPEMHDGILGDTSESGTWQHRCFPARSDGSGSISLRLGSSNVGPIYQSTYNPMFADAELNRRGWSFPDGAMSLKHELRASEAGDPTATASTSTSTPPPPPRGALFLSWLVNGLVLQTLGQPLTALAETSYRENTAVSKAAIRSWSVLGPFNESNFSFTRFGPEDGDVNLSMSYRSGFVDHPNPLRWAPVELVLGSLAIVDFRAQLNTHPNDLHGGVAFALTFLKAADSVAELHNVTLRYSTSQSACVKVGSGGHAMASSWSCKSVGTGLKRRDASVSLGQITSKNWTSVLVRAECLWGDEWALHGGLWTAQGDAVPSSAFVSSACGLQC
jgi:hypothetical protein